MTRLLSSFVLGLPKQSFFPYVKQGFTYMLKAKMLVEIDVVVNVGSTPL
jgi:hypothetical protein